MVMVINIIMIINHVVSDVVEKWSMNCRRRMHFVIVEFFVIRWITRVVTTADQGCVWLLAAGLGPWARA